jgi:diguanylate cyclase (GGDEF)-like protein
MSIRHRRAVGACRWVAAVFCMCLIGPSWALDPAKDFSHYVRDSWSIQHGLPQISVLAIAQDRAGYLWVGTQSGLARFDGVRFQTYSPTSNPELPGIWIRALLADGDRLWIGTYKGLAFLEQGRFTPVPLPAPHQRAAFDVHALSAGRAGTVYVATSEGLYAWAGQGLVADGQGPRPALSLLTEGDTVWIGGIGTVERRHGGERVAWNLPVGTAAVNQLARAHGRIWAGTSQGLFVFDDDAWRRPAAVPPALHHAPIAALRVDGDGNLWIGSNAGLARLRPQGPAEFIADDHPAAFRQVTAIHEDRERNLWLGSQLEGLARLWNGWTRRYSSAHGLHDPIVWSLARDPRGDLWVGTNDGLSILRGERFELIVPGTALPHPHAYNLLAEQDRVWIGTRRGLVLWRDGRLQAPPEFAPMATAQINGIVRGPAGEHWITTTDGLFRLRDGALRRYGREHGLEDARVRVIAFLRDGSMLAGTMSGLHELHEGRFRPVGLERGLSRDLDVTSVLELRDGRRVIGTLDDRMYIQAGNRWHLLGPEQGMPANSPFFLDEDQDGFLWAAGIRGISRVPVADLPGAVSARMPVRGEMLLNERGDPNAGQQGYCCNGAGMSKGLRDGTVLWLPSRDGVVAMDTGDIRRNAIAPMVLVERVLSRREAYSPPAHGMLLLPAEARDLGFEFTVLSYQDPHSLQIRYRLRGYDPDWQALADVTRRSVNYTNLPPGDYVFEVAGSNNAGVWSPITAGLPFRIRPLFHETALFRLLLTALLAAALYGAWRRQQLQHARRQAQLESEVRDRTRELHAANERLENASQTDPLTGLRNRRYLANQIPTDLAYYGREQRRGGGHSQVMIFALLDIDHFKQVNDVHGHAVGDRVLQQAGQLLGSLIRSGDYLARWGGEEFLLVFRPMLRHQLAAVGERIRQAFAAQAFETGDGSTLSLTCSIGLAEYPLFRDGGQHIGWEQMVELADAALYRVKQAGRDGWAAYRPTSSTDFATLMRELRTGQDGLLASGRLQLIGSDAVVAAAKPV